ncbi:MAG TPA: glycosyltransferase [Chryseosolibacter sp.]
MSIILTSYCILLLMLQIGWHKAIHQREVSKSAFYPFISVLIPVRNERERIANVLIALSKQQYNNFEVIVINDHSSDDTVDVAKKNSFANVSVITSNGRGKKAALDAGIKIAKGELIATTDADCIMDEHWLESIRKAFANEKTVFAFGAVAIDARGGFFSRVQSVEFASLVGSGAATSALGFPTMCNGANLAYRKEVYESVNGYEGNTHIASGDDEFLMRKIIRTHPHGVTFIPFTSACVTTCAQQSLSDFLSQRMRWASKWKFNTSFHTVALALYIFAVQASVLSGAVSLFVSFSFAIVLLFVIKLFLEASFISRVCRFSKSHFSWPAFLFLQLVYPLYVVLIGLVANFSRPSWKGRPVSNKG